MTSTEPNDAPAARSDPQAPHPFPVELQALAAEHAGGWVNEIDPGHDRAGRIPRDAIIGAWRIGEDGTPTGAYVGNPHYRPLRPRRRRVTRAWWVVGVLIVALLLVAAFLFAYPNALGSQTDRSPRGAVGERTAQVEQPTAARPRTTDRARSHATASRARHARRGDVHLQIVALAPVWVCLRDEHGQDLVNGRLLTPGGPLRFASGSFQAVFGNRLIELRVNGVRRPLPPGPIPGAYAITRRGAAPLRAGQAPTCP